MSDTMECPFCAETIKVKAKKCKHCNEMLVANVTQESILAEHVQNKAAMGTVVAEPVAPAQPVPVPVAETAVPAEPAPVQPVETAVSTEPIVPAEPVAEEKSDAPQIVTDDGEKAEKATTAMEIMYARIAEMPESEEKQMVVEAMAKIEAEAAKGDDGDENTLEDTIKTVVGILPDVAEIAINTAINPVSGVTTLLQKVAKRVVAGQNKKSEEVEEEEEEEKPVVDEADEAAVAEVGAVDVETAVETMSELHEQLDQLPDSEAKAVVAETLEQLSDAAEEEEEDDDDDDGGSAIADVIGSVAEALPNIVETAVDVAAQLTGT